MLERRGMQAASTDIELPPTSEVVDARVAGLTILYHPNLARVGERALLPGLESGRSYALSRLEPPFSAPGARDSRPLADHRISRVPVVMRGGTDQTVTLDCGGSRTPVSANGHPITGTTHFSRADVERGVVLLLGSRTVLLLHLLDPVTDTGQPAFGIIGYSPAIVRVRHDIRRVADFDVPVLIRGDSGTGKEAVARAIHDAGKRRAGPYLAVNLGAVPQALAASEMFGAARGAFTGAHQDRPGYFQRAQGGTLFLDEIGEAAPELQVLLLRCLESGEIQPVGGDRPRPVDVRVVSATDADLQAAIVSARFRAPLLYRLSGYVIRIPPLRERREDLGRLLVAFLRRELAAVGDEAMLDDEAQPWLPASIVARLALYRWPGNVRELANVVRHLVIANRGVRPAAHFQVLDELRPGDDAEQGAIPGAVPTPSAEKPPGATSPPGGRPSDITDDQLVAALRAHRFSPERAAAALGIPRASIYRLMDRSPRVRKASELGAEEIRAAQAAADGDEEVMAERLEVSVRALRRRMGELALRT